MSDTFRATMHFQHSYFGFSETWYKPNTTYPALLSALGRLLYTRCGMLEQQYVPLAVRLAKEDDTRHSRLLTVGPNNMSDVGGGNFNVPDRGSYGDETVSPTADIGPDNSDQTRASLQMIGLVAGKRVCLRYLAGVPDFVSLTEPKTVSDKNAGKWWKAYEDYTKAVVDDGWCIKSLNKLQTASGDLPANPLIPVIGYQSPSVSPGILGVQMPLAISFAGVQGDRILLQGVRMKEDGLKSPNGKWIIDSIVLNSITQTRTIFLRGTELFDPSLFKTLGKFRRELYTYTALTVFDFVRMGTHKRGKPFFSPRGRAKTRKYRA